MRIYFTPYDIKVPFDQLQLHTRLRCDLFFNWSPSIWLKWPWWYLCKSDTSQDCPFSCQASDSKIPSTHYWSSCQSWTWLKQGGQRMDWRDLEPITDRDRDSK